MITRIRYTVLVVDDDPQIRKMLITILDGEDLRLIECENGKSVAHLSTVIKPDLILLDPGLRNMDGKELLKTLREWCQIPIIILSSRSTDEDVIELLTLGADDYIVKPFNSALLAARIRANLRRFTGRAMNEPELINGGLRMDPLRREVFLHNKKITLTPKEYTLLKFFLVNRGKMLTHRDILHEIWGSAHDGDVQYLRTFIGQLRKKIEKDSSKPTFILTDPRIGYRMQAV